MAGRAGDMFARRDSVAPFVGYLFEEGEKPEEGYRGLKTRFPDIVASLLDC